MTGKKLRVKFQSRFSVYVFLLVARPGAWINAKLFVRVDVRKYDATSVCTAKNGSPMCN